MTGHGRLRHAGAVRKPEIQWQTRRWSARRLGGERASGWQDDPRAELFAVGDGEREARAVFGLRRQQVDPILADDPDLVHAVASWLVARGVRRLALVAGDRPLAEGPIDVDALGSVPDGVAGRLVTLAPSNAELVDALGAFDRVIACEDSSDDPPAVARCVRLGPDLAPDLDRIVELAPDLVVSSLSVPGMERITTGLRARGVPQIVCAPRSVFDVQADLLRVGRAIGVEGGPAAARMQAEVAELRASLPRRPVRVYLEWWPRPMFTPGGACYSNELVALAGGINVFGDREGASVEITADELRAAAPEVCFVSWCGVAEAKLDPAGLATRVPDLPAALGGRVFALDERYSGRPGPKLLEAARRMRAAIAACGIDD